MHVYSKIQQRKDSSTHNVPVACKSTGCPLLFLLSSSVDLQRSLLIIDQKLRQNSAPDIGNMLPSLFKKSCSLCAPSSDSISASGCVLNKICRFFDALKCGPLHETVKVDIKIPAVVIAVKGGCWGAEVISSIDNTVHCATHLQRCHQLVCSIDRGNAWSISLVSHAEDLHLGVISTALQCCRDY